ncbi:hypothetical protein WN55_01998 [Dufourea novaeangliae]|uniref:Uncharacterized protein n=1 Tax=Dufourea novaeangliae TaxID=178035 RepID=A0A154PFE5_DUFNO|nr:hypothetical protein WN55_01998 [Dufourea novaeangliae]
MSICSTVTGFQGCSDNRREEIGLSRFTFKCTQSRFWFGVVGSISIPISSILSSIRRERETQLYTSKRNKESGVRDKTRDANRHVLSTRYSVFRILSNPPVIVPEAVESRRTRQLDQGRKNDI